MRFQIEDVNDILTPATMSTDQPATEFTISESLQQRFETEKANAVARMGFINDVERRKAKITALKARIDAENADVANINEQLAKIQKDIADQREELHIIQMDHIKRQDRWLANYSKGNLGFLNFTVVKSWFKGQSKDNLDTVIEAVEENLKLLKGLSEVDSLHNSVLERQKAERVLKEDLDKKQTSLQKTQEECRSAHSDLNSAILMGISKIETTRKSALDIVATTAYQAGVLATKTKLQYTSEAGAYIRGRKLDWSKADKQDTVVVEKGNRASHYGMAMADASLYRESILDGLQKRDDVATYKSLYGVDPDFAWERQTVKRFCDFLDWRGGMKNFFNKDEFYSATRFHRTWSAILLVIKSIPVVASNCENLQEYFQKNDDTYQILKTEYEKELTRHKSWLEYK